MTIADFARRHGELERALKRDWTAIAIIAGNAVLAEMQDRIFNRGEAANGSPIGRYSTEEIYVPVPYPQVKNSRLKKVGKTGRTTKKTAFMEGGYKEFRQTVGRPTDTVNLDLTGSLRLSMGVGKRQGAAVIGFTKSGSMKVAIGNEKRFNVRIFKLTDREKEIFNRAVAKEIELLMKKVFS